jgi:hypothetical protein
VLNPAILNKLREWKYNPVSFVRDGIEATPSRQQADLLGSFPKHKRHTVRSGHGTGKDACASWLIMNFMTTRPYAKVVCTAPTNRQLGDILWSELSKWFRRSIFRDEFVIQSDKIFHKESPKEWWCRAVSPSVKASKEEQAETLAGFHGDHLLIVVDEASGVPDPVFIPLEGAMTQPDNIVLLIGNMTRNTGYFYDSHFDVRQMNKWNKLHWDSRDSENVDQAYPKYMADKYGEDSNVFRIRVMGDPPKDDERTFIPLDWAISCIDNQFEIDPYAPCYLGVDVARYGEDESIILPRKGLKIYPWSTFQGMNTIDLGGHALETLREFDADGMGVDEIGVGAGLVDWLQKLPGGLRKAHGVNVTRESSDKNRFHRLRDELWWEMREKCRKQMYWFPGDTAKERELSNELCNELSSLYYDFDNNGAYVVESKKMAKARGIKSPNIADALGISEYFYNSAYQLFLKSNDKGIRKPRPWETQNVVTVHPDNWMAC